MKSWLCSLYFFYAIVSVLVLLDIRAGKCYCIYCIPQGLENTLACGFNDQQVNTLGAAGRVQQPTGLGVLLSGMEPGCGRLCALSSTEYRDGRLLSRVNTVRRGLGLLLVWVISAPSASGSDSKARWQSHSEAESRDLLASGVGGG